MPKRRMKRHLVTQPSDQSYRLIPLTQGQNAIVDIGDFEWLSQWNWCAVWAHTIKSFYAQKRGELKTMTTHRMMHRMIMEVHSGEQVDHKNSNTLDNRRANLRKCTNAQNVCNGRMRWDNTSGFRGVVKRQNKWQAAIRKNGKAIYLGTFDTPEEAAKAWDGAARIHHGEFAHLNFPR